MTFLTEKSLRRIAFKHIGKNIKISPRATFYNAGNISIGDNSRIDDFCILSGGDGIEIGRYVHISAYVSILGKGKVKIEDFVGLASKVSVYSSNDDHSGKYMTNPTVDASFTNVTHGDVYIGKHVIVGAGSIILPNVTIKEGAYIGALSLVSADCKGFYIYGGIPAKIIKKRSRNLLKLEREFLAQKSRKVKQ